MSNIMEDITEHEIYLILLNMLLNKEGGDASFGNVNQTTINNNKK